MAEEKFAQKNSGESETGASKGASKQGGGTSGKQGGIDDDGQYSTLKDESA